MTIIQYCHYSGKEKDGTVDSADSVDIRKKINDKEGLFFGNSHESAANCILLIADCIRGCYDGFTGRGNAMSRATRFFGRS